MYTKTTVNIKKNAGTEKHDTLMKNIQTMIQQQDSSKFISYLKIANHVPKASILKHNPRFRIRYDSEKEPTFLQLSYDNTTTPFYTADNPYNTSIKGNFNNKNNFIFGKFNKILRPFVRSSANDIKVATNTDDTNLIKGDIITKLKSGKPVCIVGYGRSGSGKTTSLIQSDVDKSSGVLIQLVENLIQTGNYNKLEVTCREFMEKETQSDKYEETNIVKGFNDKTKFVDFLLDHILGNSQRDSGKRHVMATTNNKVSSRSHVIIHIKLTAKTSGNKDAHLYGGDMAGVENTFQDNTKTYKDFLTIEEPRGTKFYKKFVENTELKQYIMGMSDDDYIDGANAEIKYDDTMKTFMEHINTFKVIYDITSSEGIDKNNNNKYPSAYLLELLTGTTGDINSTLINNLMNCLITNGSGGDNTEPRKSNEIRQKDLLFIRMLVPLSYANKTINIKGKEVKIKNAQNPPIIAREEIDDFSIKLKHELDKRIAQLKTVLGSSDLTAAFSKVREITEKYKQYVVSYYGKTIVERRNKEGEYINREISTFRDNVRTILNKRNSQCLYYAPAIDPDCMDSYCPTFNECFKPKGNMESHSKSSIIEWMRIQYESQNAGKSFENDCILGVFCVLNITGNISNDPPSVPYVNINQFSKLWEEIEAYGFLDIKNMKVVTTKNLKPRSNITFETLIGNIKSSEQTTDIAVWTKRYNDVIDELRFIDNVVYTEFGRRFETLLTVDQYIARDNNTVLINGKESIRSDWLAKLNLEVKEQKSKIYKLITTNGEIPKKLTELRGLLTTDITPLLTSFGSNPSIKSIMDSGEYKAILKMFGSNADLNDLYYNDEPMTNVIVPFMEYINKHNASSDIGTIEFLDNFAKSNTVSRVCMMDKADKKTEGKYLYTYSSEMDSADIVKSKRSK